MSDEKAARLSEKCKAVEKTFVFQKGGTVEGNPYENKDVFDAVRKAFSNVDQLVMQRLRAPFGCELIPEANEHGHYRRERWRIHDANDDAIASVSGAEEGYARLIVQALNEHFARKKPNACQAEHTRDEWGVCRCES